MQVRAEVVENIYGYVWCGIPRTIRTKGPDCARHKYSQSVLFSQFNDIMNTLNINSER